MSSILSTQNRHIFLRRKNCFFPAVALSPPVGLCDALIGLPPLDSGMAYSSPFGNPGAGPAGTASAGAAGAAGTGAAGIAGATAAGIGIGVGAGLRAARLSRAFLRFSIFLIFSSMRTVMN